ncbi:MAG: DUF6326 family protein [Crocinitomicaceae bacterium]
MTKSKTTLQDFNPNIKIKLAGLWTAATLCYLYGDYFELYTPGKVEGLSAGDHIMETPIMLLIASCIMVIPPLMIAVSLLLRPKINKVLNIIFGSLFTLMMLLIAVGSLVPWYSFYVFLAIVESILTFFIIWKALKWPRVNIAD